MHSQSIGRLRTALEVEVLDDGAEARVSVDPQKSGRVRGGVTVDDVQHALSLHGIKAGFIPEALKTVLTCLQSGRSAVDLVVARAILPVEGVSGRLDMVPKSTVLEQGKVAARAVQPVMGQRGQDVRGREIPPTRINPLEIPLAGKNVEFDSTNCFFLATCPGRAVLDGRVLNIVPLRVIDGGLAEGTAPVEFEGDIEVRGSVGRGVSVSASSVVVVGDVEAGARIAAQRDLEVRGTLRSGRQAERIACGGEARFRTIEGARVFAAGVVRVDERAIDAEIRSRKSIDAPQCVVRGSVLEAVDGVRVGSVSAEAGGPVRLGAGIIQEEAVRQVELRSRINAENDRERTLVLDFEEKYGEGALVRQAAAKGEADAVEGADQLRARDIFLECRREIQDSISALSTELSELEALQRRNERAVVRVEEAVLPPCSIALCGTEAEIGSPLSSVAFSLVSGKIEVLSMAEFEKREFQRRQDPEGLEDALRGGRIAPAVFATGLRRLAESDDPHRARTAVRLALQVLPQTGFDTPAAIAASARALGFLLASAEKLEPGDQLFQQALVLIGPLIGARTADPLLYSIRGMLHAAQERYSESIADHKAAIQLASMQSKRHPTDPGIHLHYAASVFKAVNRIPTEGLVKAKPLLDLASYEVRRFLVSRPSGTLRERGLYLDQCIEECRKLMAEIEAAEGPVVVLR